MHKDPQECCPCVCICDREVSYALSLSEYLRGRQKVPFEIHVYSGWEKLLGTEPPQAVRLLIIAQSQYVREVEEAGFAPLLLLTEDEQYREEPENMSKYQSVEVIARRVRDMCMQEGDDMPQSIRHGGPMRLIGVYSPVTRCLQTTFSLCMGQLLSQKAPALYMNFEAYSGFGIMLEKSFRGSVSDLLYYNDCAREKLSGQLQMMTEKLGGLDLLPPMESWITLASIRAQQWTELLESIESVSQYAYCILDLSEHVDGIFEILRRCDVVYTITREDGFSQAKMRQYELLLKSTQYEDVLMRTRRCGLPVFRTLPADLAMLTKGELGAYAADLIMQEEVLQ